MKKLTKIITEVITGAASAATLFAGRAMAITIQEGAEAARADGMPRELLGDTGVFNQITNTVLSIIVIISIIMLVIGGFRYIVSGGDSKKVTDAKNTILYAIIGLIISFLAYAIVNFIIGTISPTSL